MKTTSKGKAKLRKPTGVPSLRSLLLKGPTMSSSQYKRFLKERKVFNAWREK
jgi:hypothetical protein